MPKEMDFSLSFSYNRFETYTCLIYQAFLENSSSSMLITNLSFLRN
jgi:hypothetical protein